jgi:hypothetical protein
LSISRVPPSLLELHNPISIFILVAALRENAADFALKISLNRIFAPSR